MSFPTLPPCDLEALLRAAGEPPLDREETKRCRSVWTAWRAALIRRIVAVERRRYLAVWLDASVEDAVDAAWGASPSRGYRYNTLALALCLKAVRNAVPEIALAGCAPVPEPSDALAHALTEAGLPARSGAGLELTRRYAVVTPYPFAGACPACALRVGCSRLRIEMGQG